MYLVKKLSTTYLRKKHVLYRCQWKRDVAKKKVFQRYPPKDFCTARYEHKYSQKKFQTSKKNENISFWAHVGPRSAWENSGKCLVLSGEIPSPWQSSIDKTNDCAMKSERGALVRVSDSPSGHSVHETICDTWRAPARRLIQTHALLCRKQATKFLDPSPMAKNRLFFRFGGRA